LPPEGDDVASLLLDPSETENAFGWKASVGLAEGLKRQVAWFDAHGVGQTYTHLAIGKRS
jgi:nucleoside-diphosphate-sugar epimerase